MFYLCYLNLLMEEKVLRIFLYKSMNNQRTDLLMKKDKGHRWFFIENHAFVITFDVSNQGSSLLR